MGDSYTNFGSNSGHIGPNNYYGHRHEMTDALLAVCWVQAEGCDRIEATFHGTNPKSIAQAERLLQYFAARGKATFRVGGTLMGMIHQHLTATKSGSTIRFTVDADK